MCYFLWQLARVRAPQEWPCEVVYTHSEWCPGGGGHSSQKVLFGPRCLMAWSSFEELPHQLSCETLFCLRYRNYFIGAFTLFTYVEY